MSFIDTTELRSLMGRVGHNEGSAGALLDELAGMLFADANPAECDPDGLDLLANMGRGWMCQFGCTVSQDAEGELNVAWGTGDDFTHCSLGDLIVAADDLDAPDWYESDWILVQDNDGCWTTKDLVAAANRQIATEA